MGDEEDEGFGGLYEDGHWVWDENTQALVFISDLPPAEIEDIHIQSKAPTIAVQFREDIDLIEQYRYKRRYQRKPVQGKVDFVTLQDIKDIAIYSAPIHILSPMLIDLLHLATVERFHRALIFCCAYYIQVVEEMTLRKLECKTKIRTNQCEILEKVFRENLSDLRVLVAKEYSMLLIGGGDLKKFHHMGYHKKSQSLSDKDARLFETFVIMSIQIVYLALGRRNYRSIEFECQRVFKSEIFNVVEHRYKTRYLERLTPEERNVLLGTCLLHERKLNTRSPLMNELICQRPIDYRLMGLGVIKFEEKTTRLHYFYLIVAGPEEQLHEERMSVGIIGMKRAVFDIMLHPVNLPAVLGDKSKASVSSKGKSSHFSKSATKSSYSVQRIYPEIIIPEKDLEIVSLPSEFSEKAEHGIPVSKIQRALWQTRLQKLTQPNK